MGDLPAGRGQGGAHEIAVRRFRRADIPGVVDLFRTLWPYDLVTDEELGWRIDHTSRSERTRRWVAIDADRVVGFAVAGLEYMTVDRTAYAWFGVLPEARHRGIGSRLFRALDEHLAGLDRPRTWSGCAAGDDESAGFLARRGFERRRAAQVWSLDPRAVDAGELEDRRRSAAAQGIRLLSLGELEDRPRDLFELYLVCDRDAPWEEPVGYRFDQWRRHSFARPMVDRDGSFFAVAGERPVAQAWLLTDRAGRRAGHDLTGTHPDFRHRGLARLVKLATIHWAAEQGFTVIYTDNDTENRDMLALNEHLGYRPLLVLEDWFRDAGVRRP